MSNWIAKPVIKCDTRHTEFVIHVPFRNQMGYLSNKSVVRILQDGKTTATIDVLLLIVGTTLSLCYNSL